MRFHADFSVQGQKLSVEFAHTDQHLEAEFDNVQEVTVDADGYEFGHGLIVEGRKVSVNTADTFDEDNTLPASAALVLETVGNIEALLGTI